MPFKDRVKDFFNKRSESRQEEEAFKKDIELQEAMLFQKEYKKNALKAAQIRAKRDAYEKSGLGKLRAISQANAPTNSTSARMQKFKEYRQANLMRRDQNIKRTKAMQKAAKEMRPSRLKRPMVKPFERRSF